MSYTINKTDGSVLAVIPDNTVNNDYSVTIVGRNYAGYGEFLGENYIRLLENGNNLTAPSNPLTGQLWFDNSVRILKIFNGSIFKNLGSITANTSAPAGATIGDLWFDTVNEQLFIHNGVTYILIGPTSVAEGGTIVDTIRDDLGIDHTVVKFVVDSGLMAIMSQDAIFYPATPIPGFISVMPGIHMASSVNGLVPLFEGTARRALNVDDGSGDDVDMPDLLADVDGKVNRAGDAMLDFLTLHATPTDMLHAATKGYVDTAIATGGAVPDPSKVNVAGDTMTGDLTLNADPTINLHAATKQYVDNEIIGIGSDPTKVNVAGDTMTGFLTLDAEPISNLHAATKKYVDDTLSSAIGGISEFDSGVGIIFSMVSAPTGWTQDITDTDRMLRLVNGPGGGTGGTNSPIASHTHVVNAHTHTMSHTHTAGAHTHATSAHTLTTAEMPAHRHFINTGGGFNSYYTNGGFAGTVSKTNYYNYTDWQGSGTAHSHGNTQSSSGDTGASSTANTGSDTGATSAEFTPKYINIISAIKD